MDKFNNITPISVVAKDLSVSVAASRSPLGFLHPQRLKAVLSNINLTFSAGQLVGILGSSGSGKTTLLNALAGRTLRKHTEGTVEFDGKTTANLAYLQQSDHLMPYLTVRESLRYTARLRLSSTVPLPDKYSLVEQVILQLGLKECADTLIGDDWIKGISGGEKRRVSVGCQLLLNPSVIFMDEATTGLDSSTALNLIETLVTLARLGRTIFITIHQPRADIFNLFDSVILLSAGRTLYAGKGGGDILHYFNLKGFSCPLNSNPADFLIDITSVDNRSEDSEIETRKQVQVFACSWDAQVRDHTDINYQFHPILGTQQPNQDSQIIKPHQKGASSIQQFVIITERCWKNSLRDNLSLWGNLIEVVAVSIVFGLIFLKRPENVAGVLSIRAALYFICSMQNYLMVIFVVYKTCNSMKIYDRDRQDDMYGVIPYLLGTFIAQLPFNILFPYFMLGLRTDDLWIHLGRFVLANVLAHFVVVTYSQFCVAISRDFATASLVANSMFTFFSFSTGFFVQLESIPIYIRWIGNISFLTYEYRALASNEFSDRTYACFDRGTVCKGNEILSGLAIKSGDYSVPYIANMIIFLVFLCGSAIILKLSPAVTQKHAGSVTGSDESPVHPEKKPVSAQKIDASVDGIVDIQLSNISLHITTKSYSLLTMQSQIHKKTLLDNISIHIPNSSLTIIMGGSGTGKSTLLSVLAARKLKVSGIFTRVVIDGKMEFNGVIENDAHRIASFCSFVSQSDSTLLPALTCRETLRYAARLRLPADISTKEKLGRADSVMDMLGLGHCGNTIVGSDTVKGLSGGEKRRLSIGVQMLTDPSVLVIDEPTSGLDAFTSRYIMSDLKRVAGTGRSVFCSIHQPRGDIFEMFDQILLLTRGGRVAYSGSRAEIREYFGTLGHPFPECVNPADFLLDITSIDLRNEEAELSSRVRVDKIVEAWSNRPRPSLEMEIDVEASRLKGLGCVKMRQMSSFSAAFPVLLSRSYLNSRRQPLIVIARILQVTFLGIIQALYFAPQGTGQVSVQNRLGLIQQTMSTLFIGLLNCVAVFPMERDTLFSEHSDRAYGVLPFFMAYNMIEVPIEFISGILFTLFAMVLVGLTTSWKTFFCMTFVVLCLVNIGESIGIAFCSIVRHVGFSVSITNSVLGIFTVMSGIMSSGMPIFLDRINRISPIPYLARLLVINEFESTSVFTCTLEEIQNQICFYRNGDDVLRLIDPTGDGFSFDRNAFWLYLLVGASLTIVYRFASFVILKYNAV